ncbi:hypothetical protein [Nocardia tengchongensis]|uniref:hypothetical protein n=1 Tax=Nocardia tengchongensis TaxID=2055889 RepID=UPI00361FF570
MITCTRVLVRMLYPRPYRDRWGEDLCEAAQAEGWRSWPNLVASAVTIWLQPAIWPSGHRGQRSARTAAMVLAVAGCGWFLANLITEDADPSLRCVLQVCSVGLLAGCALVTPVPHPNPAALAAVVRRSIRYFAVPAVLIAAVVLIVHGGVLPAIPPLPIRPAIVGLWWAGWLLAVGAGSRALANLGPESAVAPGGCRAGVGCVILAGVAVAAGAVMVTAAFSGAGVDPFAAVCGTFTLTFAFAGAAALCELPALADD